jgi:hypothetical protein
MARLRGETGEWVRCAEDAMILLPVVGNVRCMVDFCVMELYQSEAETCRLDGKKLDGQMLGRRETSAGPVCFFLGVLESSP